MCESQLDFLKCQVKDKVEEVIVPSGNEFKSIFETIFQNFTGIYIVATWSDPLFIFFSVQARNRKEKVSTLQKFYFKN